MKSALRCLATILLITVGSTASAEDENTSLADMQARLVQSDVLRAAFRQEKTLSALNRPLVSEGRIVFARGKGVLWQINAPYAAQVLMRPGEVVEWDAAGEARRIESSANPVFTILTDVVLGVLTGDEHVLRQHFVVASEPLGPGWRLTLTPDTDALGRVVSTVQVSGDRHIELVEVAEARGDRTVIQFSGFTTEPAELDERETSYFSH